MLRRLCVFRQRFANPLAIYRDRYNYAGFLTPLVVRAYHERVIDHYKNPRNVGSLPKDDPKVGTGLVGAPACGDVMKLQIRVNSQGIIEEAVFKTFGCGSAIASSSLATEWVKGKHVSEALHIKNTEIAKHLSLPPVKLHCSMLAEDAIRAAIKDWENKQKKLKGDDTTQSNNSENVTQATS
jgi:Fe-S cluster assembly scaffold IscU